MSDRQNQEKTMTEAPPEAPPVDTTPDADEPLGPGPRGDEEPQFLQPVDVVDEEVLTKTVAVHQSAGFLTLDPRQSGLTDDQKAALAAIGIDTNLDPGVRPHLQAFMHMCQSKGLDPWAREAYLIGRGKDAKRKWTMQTGIDGYRKLAKATGRFIRVKKMLWTGDDNATSSWREVADEDGDIVMKRVWYAQWPDSMGAPGAAKVVIEHLDEDGETTTTSAVANWAMYAPYKDVWEGSGSNRRPKRDDRGNVVQELNEMWAKGGPHMLAKCAEALAYRMAFPSAMNGFYITEEMARADQRERNDQQNEGARARREAFAAAKREQRTATPTMPEEKPTDVVDAEVVDEPASDPQEPVSAAQAVEEVVDDLQAREQAPLAAQEPVAAAETPASDDAWLRGEFAIQAEILGQTPKALARRAEAANRKDYEDFDHAEMLDLVTSFRLVISTITPKAGDSDQVALYINGLDPEDTSPIDPEMWSTDS